MPNTQTPTTRDNPLLQFDGLPRFDAIRPEHVQPAITQLIAAADRALERVGEADFPADWHAISKTLDVAVEHLGRAWGSVSHLKSVLDSPPLREAYNAALPEVAAFHTRLGSDHRLYAKYKAMDPATLNAEQKQARQNALRDFVLGGAELTGATRERFAQIQQRLAELTQKFSENALDATDAFAYCASPEEVAGVPQDVLQPARAAAAAEGKDGYKLTLQIPCYLPIMQFATDRALRERMYRAYVTRASDQAPADARQYDNTATMHEILALRQEEARLLDHANFGELSLVPKMAESTDQVLAFLRELAAKARPWAERDVADLRRFATESLGLSDPQAWDWTFVGERLKEQRFGFTEQDVKPYFPAPRVLAGLFKIAETLFDLRIHGDEAPVWHPEVRFYRIERNGQLLGQFYYDPTARTGKRGGAWMDDARSRWLRPDTGALQTPVAYLVCNFSAPSDDEPALMTHSEVTTLFHEFGHGLQHMLTQVDELDVSGINGVEWDAVELPSQFMENFCWEWEVVRHLTAHVDSGEPLPRALFDKMLAARNYHAGMQTLRQIEFALFDMLLHTDHDPAADFQPLVQSVRSEVAVLQPPAFNRMAHTFGHIFAGGYAAGYYSYKWAEVLSADAYAAFEETAATDGMPNPETGRRYRQAILEPGGSRPAMASFREFRGREPSMQALLRHQGMA